MLLGTWSFQLQQLRVQQRIVVRLRLQWLVHIVDHKRRRSGCVAVRRETCPLHAKVYRRWAAQWRFQQQMIRLLLMLLLCLHFLTVGWGQMGGQVSGYFTLFLLLPPLCPSVLKPYLETTTTRIYNPHRSHLSQWQSVQSVCYLHPGFCQLDAQSKLLSKEYIRIVRLLKGSLQFLQLEVGECGAVSALLSLTNSRRLPVLAPRACREIVGYENAPDTTDCVRISGSDRTIGERAACSYSD